MRIQIGDLTLGCFLTVTFLIGAWRITAPIPAPHVQFMGTGSVVLEGTIADAPEISDTWITYTVGRLSHSGAALGGRIQVRDNRMWPRYSYGERVSLEGNVKAATDEGYDRSLRARNIQASMFGPLIDSLSPAPLSAFGTLISVRETIEARIRRLFPEPDASLAVGLLTGTRASFPKSLTDALRTSGLTHITAVSGSNVAIVLALLETLLFWVPRRWRLVPLVSGIALFGLFTGASASVVRACIMGGLGVLALHAGRIAQARRTILWTAGFMLLWNPRLLQDDLGFQLSFLSVLGILEISPHLEKFLQRIPDTLALRESIALTLSSQIAAAPWIAYKLGNLSLVALPANLLAGPLIPWAMLLGALAVLTGLPVAFIANIPLRLIIAVAEGTAALPYASLNGLAIPWWSVAAYYAALILALCIRGHTKNPAPVTERGDRSERYERFIMLSSDRRPAP